MRNVLKAILFVFASVIVGAQSVVAAGSNYVSWATVQENTEASAGPAITAGIFILGIIISVVVARKIFRAAMGR